MIPDSHDGAGQATVAMIRAAGGNRGGDWKSSASQSEGTISREMRVKPSLGIQSDKRFKCRTQHGLHSGLPSGGQFEISEVADSREREGMRRCTDILLVFRSNFRFGKRQHSAAYSATE